MVDAEVKEYLERIEARLSAKIDETSRQLLEQFRQLGKDKSDERDMVSRHEKILKDHNHRIADIEQELRLTLNMELPRRA